MEFLKANRIVILLALTVLVLVFFRSTGIRFKSDAAKLGVESFDRSNIVLIENIGLIPGEKLLIMLDGAIPAFAESNFVHSISISPDSILHRQNYSLIRKNTGPVLLYSADPGLSARTWMLLSQMGVDNLFIVSAKDDNEVFKYKFRPDSIRPEL